MFIFVCWAVLLAIECVYLLWMKERSWVRVVLPRHQITFPPFCPSCLVASAEVECVEASFSRTVGPTRKEFVTLAVPYCQACGTALNSDRKRAWNVGVAVAILVLCCCWIWSAFRGPLEEGLVGTACMVGLPLVWPVYSLYGHRKRAFCARRYNQQKIEVRVKHLVYAEALRLMNEAPS
jgi:hypothetical protein